MLVRASSGSGNSGNLSCDTVTKGINQSLVLETENCMVSVNNTSPAANRSLIQALVYEGNLIYGDGGAYGNVSYNTTTKTLTVTGTYSGLTYYMSVLGDYNIIS